MQSVTAREHAKDLSDLLGHRSLIPMTPLKAEIIKLAIMHVTDEQLNPIGAIWMLAP